MVLLPFLVNKDFVTSKPVGGRCRVGVAVRTPAAAVRLEKRPRQLVNAARRGTCRRAAAACANHIVSTSWRPSLAGVSTGAARPASRNQGGYIFYAGASLAGAGCCRQCRRRPARAILPLQLWQGCHVCVKISAQRLPRVAQFYAC